MKDKRSILIIQLSGKLLKTVNCLRRLNLRAEFKNFDLQEVPSGNNLSSQLIEAGFNSREIIAALPGNQATCRFLKIPGANQEELEKISILQASRYLPYPAEELVTAYQVIRSGQESFSDILLTIAHRNSITEYHDLLKPPLKASKLDIILSFYGICNLFYEIEPKEAGTVMLIDLDNQRAELVIAAKGKIIFGRSTNLNNGIPGWEEALLTEITKTSDAFTRDIQGERIEKIVLLGAKNLTPESLLKFERQAGVPFEFLNYFEKLNIQPVPEAALNHSFASLIGLGLKSLPESLNILPKTAKETNARKSRRKERLKLGMLVLGSIIVSFLGISISLENKTRYLQNLEKETAKITAEARPLESIEKRFKLIENNAGKKDSPLDILYELHRLIPEQISLISLSYEENRRVVIHGRAADLNAVLNLVAALEKSPAFEKFNIKIRFATRKKIQTGEVVDFEIGCLK